MPDLVVSQACRRKSSVPTQASVPTQTFRFVVIARASPAFQCSSFIRAVVCNIKKKLDKSMLFGGLVHLEKSLDMLVVKPLFSPTCRRNVCS